MGLCKDGKENHDIFISYAHDDNIAHNYWVSDFQRYLKEKVIAGIRRQGNIDEDRVASFSICIDEKGFPESGDLITVIDEKVRQSQYLFIFLGSGYLNSEWCLSELDIFRKAIGGTIQDALQRLYLIVLDRDALERLREGSGPRRMSQNFRPLWKKLQSITQKAIRIEQFLQDDGRLLPVYRDRDRADNDFHECCTRIVDELVGKLVKDYETLNRPSSVPERKHIVIGAVPERLEAFRNELVEALREMSVSVVDRTALEQPDRVYDCLKDAKVFIQPFDRFEPIVRRGDPKGGHLAVQKQLFERCSSEIQPTADIPMIWWEPRIPEAFDAPGIDAFDKAFIDEIDRLPADQRRRCDAREMADELLGREKKALLTAKVWVEWEESDEQIITEAKKLVREYFQAHCKAKEKEGIYITAALTFGVADWAILARTLKEKPDGVVIVYNENKDVDALMEQAQTISNLEEVLLKKMFPGIFYLRPKGMFLPSEDWRVVRFKVQDQALSYKREELEKFVSNLFEVIHNKYNKR